MLYWVSGEFKLKEVSLAMNILIYCLFIRKNNDRRQRTFLGSQDQNAAEI